MAATSARPRVLLAVLLLGLAAEALFAFRLATPHVLMFDEVHYVPAARTLLKLLQPVNTEHPLLGKAIIAAGIALFGDNSIGWRLFSTIAGAATVMGVATITWQLTRRTRTAVLAGLFAMLNITIFVQARIAMLDGFMAAFVMLSIVALVAAFQHERHARWLLALAGLLLGLAIGSKWTAAPFLGYAGLAVLAIGLHTRRPIGAIVIRPALLGGAATLAYLATFAPAFFYARDPLTLATLLPFQATMYAEQTQVLPAHLYQSSWWSWPLMLRPIWYLYQPVDGAIRGVLLVGNPAILWGGLIALPVCLWRWTRTRDPRLLVLVALWAGAYLPWIVIPKSLGFFYYYYLPSIFLCPVLAAAITRPTQMWLAWDSAFLALAAGLFVYFYPIIAALPLAAPDAFHHWAWFSSWV